MATPSYPGVYIEEQTGPGVIAGVGTSTAGFIGPALRGPIGEPRRVSSYDEFLSVYALLDTATGIFQPYITSPRLYMAHAVRGFFENGGQQLFIVRIGTAKSTTWTVKNQASTPEPVFRLQALAEGVQGNGIAIQMTDAQATGAGGVLAVKASSVVKKVTDTMVDVEDASQFQVGDSVTKAGAKTDQGRARITGINANQLTLDKAIAGLAATNTLRIANFDRSSSPTLRLAGTQGLFPGTVVEMTGRNADDSADQTDRAVVQSVNAANFVTFYTSSTTPKIFCLEAAAKPLTLVSRDFKLEINSETFNNLSIHPLHPRNVFTIVSASKLVRVLAPQIPPVGVGVEALLVSTNVTREDGKDDDLGTLDTDAFLRGLDALDKIDEVNIVCIPDAAARSDWRSIQTKMIEHCVAMKDRVAILDSRLGLPPHATASKNPELPASIEDQRGAVQSERGFAALYYPWLQVRDPTSKESPPRTMLIPPSGHMAGIFARTDQERGVHKAPANTDVRGVLGLEVRLSDAEQGPLNLAGINVLRIFPGSGTVIVWGARTTVDPAISDWLYVPVRRLLLMIEESIQEGIRPAVFEPNAPPLWKSLKRTISQFLTQVWRDGGLFGDTPDKAFSVRIDEGLNPPDVRARGELFMEIGVAAVRPAEFIIVRIGLQDGGGSVQEG